MAHAQFNVTHGVNSHQVLDFVFILRQLQVVSAGRVLRAFELSLD